MEATASIHFSHLHTFLPPSSSFLSLPSKFPSPKPCLSPHNLAISISTPLLPLKCLLYSSAPSAKPSSMLHCSGEEVAVLENPNETQDVNQKRKLYVVNLPWSNSVDDLKNAFSQCGTVTDVEIIKNKDGKSRGYAFVTMASGDEAQAVIDTFHNQDFSGRTIGVEYAKRFRKPRPQPPADIPPPETRHQIYVSNLQWQVRASHLREFFSANFNPVTAKVLFEKSSRRSAGYGFVSFGTIEEAKAAVSALDGKELMGRPVCLKLSDRITEENEAGEKEEEKDDVDESVTETIKEEEEKDDMEESVTETVEEEAPSEQPENS